MSAMSDASQSTYIACLPIRIYHMVIYGYIHTAKFKTPINKNASTVTQMTMLTVVGLKYMSTMQKIS